MAVRVCIFSLLISLNLSAQDQIDFFLARFQVDVVGENVIILYTLRSGAICNDLVIERAANDDEFTEIYRHFGVCGFTDRDAHYHFIDENAPSGLLKYRVVIYENIVSEPIQIKFIRLSGEKALVAPNPVHRIATIYYSNPAKEWFYHEIYDNQGNLVKKGQSQSNEINIDLSTRPAGSYYYRIFNNKISYQGRILKN